MLTCFGLAPDHTVRRTVLTCWTKQFNCTCLNHKERDKQNNVSADRWMWRYPFENPFLIRLCRHFPFTRFTVFWYKPCGYQADNLRTSLTSIHFSHSHFFPQHFGYAPFRLPIKSSTIHVYAHRWACPDKAAQMLFRTHVVKPALGMIEFQQIV